MAYKFPTQGGCWFCYMDDGEMHFSTEFDTWFHMDCLNKELGAGNPEAEIIATEYGIEFESKFIKAVIEMKLCPFCGGEAGITWDKWQDDELYCCVECDCGVSTGVYETVDEAAEHWNRRIE